MIQDSPKTSWTDGKSPRVDDSAYVHPTAVVIGDVDVRGHVFVGPHASLRGDEGGPLVIGEGSNVQDGVVMHALKGATITVGREVCVAHMALVHGPCTVGDTSFVGFGAKVFNATIGRGCFLSTGALVTNVDLPDGKLVPDMQVVNTPALLGSLADVGASQRELAAEVVEVNKEFAKGYSRLTR